MRHIEGNYTTPKVIIDFCINLIKPSSEHLILDPACGTGGFLKGIQEYFKKNKSESYEVFGIEIEKELYSLTKKDISEDSSNIKIINADSLSSFNELKNINSILKPNVFDLILTSPPFGYYEKSSKNYSLNEYNQIEVLFLERNLEFLKPNGKMAIILPDFILKLPKFNNVRKFILRKSTVLSIVSIPQFAFVNFGSKMKTSILFLEKKDSTKINENSYPIFMAIANHVGIDGKGKNDPKNDFKTIINEYESFTKNKDNYSGYNIEADFYG